MTALAAGSRIDSGAMRLERVEPHDLPAVTASVDLLNAAQRVDDPDGDPGLPELASGWLEFGWDLEPDSRYLYLAPGGEPVAVLEVALPRRDNLHLVWGSVIVHPAHRRQGHGTALVAEIVRRAEEAGRTTIWLGTAEDDLGSRAFLEANGFHYASHDARRKQVLAEVDTAAVDARHAKAVEAAADYVIERLEPPYTDELLEQLVEVTAAINDAPMGDLTFEDEVFDVARLQDIEKAREGRGDRIYRLAARHRQTGVIGGHTVVVVNPLRPEHAGQGDTAVHRDHRGHRLGLLLKIEMMRLLAETEPQITEITTWNNADNSYMIDVNEAIGYRLSRVFAMYERTV
ncbi:MAG TPA: GNAT family N-acetyltransferase [Microlunatus sp.]